MVTSDSNLFLLKKTIDWSLLTNGMTIPVEFQPLVQSQPGGIVALGENRQIKILIDNEVYDATLNSVNFDRNKYSNHKDLLQIRFTPKSPIALKLQSVFEGSFNYFQTERQKKENFHRQIKLPAGINEYVVLYSTIMPNVFEMECYTAVLNDSVTNDIKEMTELEYEAKSFEPKTDSNASIVEKVSIQKYRHLDLSIANSLKKLYDYRCQITGEKIGDEYGGNVIEAHHIEYFTKSLNNDSSNIIILSPNFHRIIHKNNPHFNREKLCFEFENGIVEKIRLDKHLRVE